MWGNLSQSVKILSTQQRVVYLVRATAVAGLGVAALSVYGAAQPRASSSNGTFHDTISAQQTSHSDAPLQGSAEINDISADLSEPKSDLPTSTVRINDQTVTLPENGSLHTTIRDNNGTTSVDFSTQAQSSGSTQSMTSLSINSQSTSETQQTSETTSE